MWTRAELKLRAKEVLRKSYWKAFIVSIVLGVVTGGGGGSSGGNANYSMNSQDIKNLPLIIFAGIGVVILMALLRFLLGTILEVGARKYFVEASSKSEFNMGHLGFGFKNDRYMNIVITMFYRGILLFLWTLLLIIPGIIKAYAYRMVPYILTENPKIAPKRAIELSNKMTDGEKMNMFVLDLSFIGWYLLGLLALCIGVLFVVPYYETTYTELYLVLRNKVIKEGQTTRSEFNLEGIDENNDEFTDYYRPNRDDDNDDDWR